MIKIGFISLGCAKNQVDLERLAGSLSGGFHFVKEAAECDVMIVNTCGFIRDAVEEGIRVILSVKEQIPPHAKLVVFGCMAERYREDMAKELKEIDFYTGVGEQREILAYLASLFPEAEFAENKRYLFNLPYYAYLKISEGCDNRCTYCTIPTIRGAHRSVPKEALLSETAELAKGGVKEIIIISQDSTKYGLDRKDGYLLHHLVDDLAKTFPGVYFRLMYLNPDGVTPDLIRAVKNNPNVLRYFEIPVQHISDRVLKRMNRHSDSRGIKELFGLIRRELPDAFLRTTFMVGFPGESEEDFQELEAFLRSTPPDHAGFFIYSPEEGTPAASFQDQVPLKTAKKRMRILQAIQRKNSSGRLKKMKSGEIVCFIDRANDEFSFILEGRAHFQAPDVDGRLYVTDGVASHGAGPYAAKIIRVAYPDIFVRLIAYQPLPEKSAAEKEAKV